MIFEFLLTFLKPISNVLEDRTSFNRNWTVGVIGRIGVHIWVKKIFENLSILYFIFFLSRCYSIVYQDISTRFFLGAGTNCTLFWRGTDEVEILNRTLRVLLLKTT